MVLIANDCDDHAHYDRSFVYLASYFYLLIVRSFILVCNTVPPSRRLYVRSRFFVSCSFVIKGVSVDSVTVYYTHTLL